MRKRSGTLHAENMDQYTAFAIQPSLFEAHQKQSKQSKAKSSLSNNVFWEDFNYKTETNEMMVEEENFDNVSTEQNSGVSEMSASESESPVNFISQNNKPFITKRLMVLSSTQADSYNLINSSFQTNGDLELAPLNQTMDLVIKSDNDERIKYHFWLKALEDRRFNSLVRVYYKTASAFIFVYSVSSRESFNLVEQAIQEVLSEIPREKFIGILIGNQQDLEENREVSYFEGSLLQSKYGLVEFGETSQDDNSLKEKITNIFGAIL
jgi:hypothetical protein